MPDDIARIAEELTEAQRRELVSWGARAPSTSTVIAFTTLGLVIPDSPQWFTPLGRAVAEHLEREG